MQRLMAKERARLLAIQLIIIPQVNLLIFDECHHTKKTHPFRYAKRAQECTQPQLTVPLLPIAV